MQETKTDTVFISGATGYVGSHITRSLGNEGYNLILTGSNPELLLNLKNQVLSLNGQTKLEIFHCDLSESKNWQTLTEFLDQFNVTHFINCAGTLGIPTSNISDLSFKDHRKVFEINLNSAIYLTFYFAKKWVKEDFHNIIHFSGGGATSPRPIFQSYSLSKTALVRFVENCSLMKEFEKISINIISPGAMPSKMQEQILDYPELSSTNEYEVAINTLGNKDVNIELCVSLSKYLLKLKNNEITCKIISSKWDNWKMLSEHQNVLKDSDVFTLRRIIPSDRGLTWNEIN